MEERQVKRLKQGGAGEEEIDDQGKVVQRNDDDALVKEQDLNAIFIPESADVSPTAEIDVDAIFQYATNKHHQRVQPVSPPGYQTIQLKPYQEEGLAWMLIREAKENEKPVILRQDWTEDGTIWRNVQTGVKTTQAPASATRENSYAKQTFYGGLLADEMGLGKTVQMIALISTHPKPRDIRRDTLIVVPAIMLGTWQKELKRWAPWLTVYVHHGSNRTRNYMSSRFDRNVVLTTYGIMKNDIKFLTDEVGVWWRVVLDEGHIIRNAESDVARAAHALDARNRWVMTGTPIQNRWTDMFSLLKFLHVRPYGEWQGWRRFIDGPMTQLSSPFKKQATEILQNLVQSLVLRRTKTSKTQSVPLFEKGLVVRISGQDGFWKVVNLGRREYVVEKQEPPDPAGRRRMGRPTILTLPYTQNGQETTYEFIKELIHLPEKTYRNISISWEKDSEERRVYDDLAKYAKRQLQNREQVEITNTLELLLRLRQATIHPWLTEKQNVKTTLEQVKSGERQWFPGAKIAWILQQVRQTKPGGVREDEKSLIFSQFTSALDLLDYALRRDGWISQTSYERMSPAQKIQYADRPRFIRIQGNTPYAAREAAIEALQEDNNMVRLALLSLYATGVGLTLTRANNVYFMDLAFNPQIMAQAVDRTHRIGQQRPVKVRQLIVPETVESKMLLLLEHKLQVAGVALDPPRLTIDQILNLI